MIPALAAIIGLVGYPTLYAIWMSFHTKLLAVKAMPFVGLDNYVTVLSRDYFWSSLGRTVMYTAVAVALKACIGMVTALVLNESWPGRGLARAMVLLPWALPPLTAVVTWRFLFSDTTNVLNYVLIKAHLIGKPILWLAKAEYAMPAAIIVNVWQGFPFFAITLLAGLSPIPDDLYDAAKVDGAGVLQRFRYVTLPGVFPVLMVALTLSTIWTFNQFPTIWLLTQGGPGDATTTLPIAAYMEAFVAGSKNLSIGAVYAVLTFPVLLILVWLLNHFVTAREEAVR
jgi:multiple sugar transport system permease protein